MRSNTPNWTDLVGIHQRHIHTKFEANACRLRKEVKKVKSSQRRQVDRQSHTHLLSVTKIDVV